MGDVAHILGITHDEGGGTGDIPQQVVDLLGAKSGADLPPIVPTNTGGAVKVGTKWISSKKKARKWAWAPFSSSSRTDGLLLHHWVRANVEYPDYPFARFDLHLDPVTYASEEEYQDCLQDPNWTKAETDKLLELAKRFELRWPVIYDRWCEHFDYFTAADTPKFRKLEDIQHRYFAVAAILLQSRITHEAHVESQTLAQNLSKQVNPSLLGASEGSATAADDQRRATTDARLIETAAARALATAEPQNQPLIPNIGTGATNKVPFDLEYERERREHLERLWNRTKEEEEEEAALRQELKQVEAQLRKLKKSGAHLTSKGGAAASRAATPVQDMSPEAIEKAFTTTAPVPVPGTPYLQSARLVSPACGGTTGLSKTLMSKLHEILGDMNVQKPLPTKKACDLYDTVRKNIITLLVLQKSALHKEGVLQSKRLALGKRSGSTTVVDEETLMGIEPPPPREAPQQAASIAAKAPRPVKPKSSISPKAKNIPGSAGTTATAEKKAIPSVVTTNVTSAVPPPPLAAASTKAVKKAPNATKRKRKADTNKSPTAAIAAAAVAAAAAEVVQQEARAAAAAAVAAQPASIPTAAALDAAKPPGKKRAKKST